jgi:hypothetical protein
LEDENNIYVEAVYEIITKKGNREQTRNFSSEFTDDKLANAAKQLGIFIKYPS